MLLLRVKHFLKRVTPLTWAIWLTLAADLLAPGQWKYDYLIFQVDLTELVDEVTAAYAGSD